MMWLLWVKKKSMRYGCTYFQLLNTKENSDSDQQKHTFGFFTLKKYIPFFSGIKNHVDLIFENWLI